MLAISDSLTNRPWMHCLQLRRIDRDKKGGGTYGYHPQHGPAAHRTEEGHES